MKELKPIKDKDSYADPIFQYIARQMFDMMYDPLFKILGKRPDATTLSNALDRSSVTAALLSGQIWFNDNKFYGNFNSAIGRELRRYGANFNSLDKTYFIKAVDLPMNIRAVIGEANSKFQAQQNAIAESLNKMNKAPQLSFKEILPKLNYVFIDLGKQFTTSVPQGLNVPMDLTPNMREVIAEDYTYNLNLYIKNWHDSEIIKLREIVNKSVAQGYRAEFMQHVLEAQYGVAERKAKFLARQETSLLVSKYREARYKEAGLNKYRWSTSRDQRVRADHRALEGKIFDWDHPPITDRSTGARNHPGQDFGPCRCLAIPLIE